MRFSSTYIPTLKESPSEAEVVSHKLLLRAASSPPACTSTCLWA